MRRLVLFAALLFLCLAPRLLQAEARKCLQGCPKQIPCEFMFELKKAKLMLQTLENAGTYEEYMEKIPNELSKYAGCPPNIFYGPPESFAIDRDGSIAVLKPGRDGQQIVLPLATSRSSGLLSLEEVLLSSNSCSEAVKANHAAAKRAQFLLRSSDPIDVWALRMIAQARVDSLENSMFQACSAAWGFPEALAVAKKGTDALNKTASAQDPRSRRHSPPR